MTAPTAAVAVAAIVKPQTAISVKVYTIQQPPKVAYIQ